MSAPARVLVVDDSAFVRKVLRESLNASRDIEVVGIARDGLEALEKVLELTPDVITLDLTMPSLDGLGVLRELIAAGSPARIVLVSNSDRDSELVVEALRLGAFAVVRKPTSVATDQLYQLGDELVRTVIAAAGAHKPLSPPPMGSRRAPAPSGAIGLVVIGTSTGGPNALTQMLAGLPGDFPVPVAVALHIPGEYTPALARRLNEDCQLAVIEAREETVLRPGLVVVAKGGLHLRIDRRGGALVAWTSREPADAVHFPSVDLLFESAAQVTGARTLGVVLTGMGDDGLRGARAIVAAGGVMVTEAEESCVVYGMPRCVEQAGLSAAAIPLDGIAAELMRRARTVSERES